MPSKVTASDCSWAVKAASCSATGSRHPTAGAFAREMRAVYGKQAATCGHACSTLAEGARARSPTPSARTTLYTTLGRRRRTRSAAYSGRPPKPRQNAQCALLPGTGLLVVFGGWRLGPMANDVNLGDTHVLDLDGGQSFLFLHQNYGPG
jgi:hypothetical protein